jgi:molecular chaperone DnaK
MIMEVPLHDAGENTIRLHVFDSTGRPIEGASETLVITKVHASAAGIPATQTIAVKVVEDMGSNRNALEPLVEKGRLLPASGTKRFRAARALKAGQQDYLEFALFQDEGVPEIHLNLCVGSFRISGTDLPDGMAVKMGDPIDIRWFMSDSGLLQASIDLPSLGQTFETPKFYSPQTGHKSFSIEEGTQLAAEAIEDARKELDSAEEAIGTSIHHKAQQIREMLSEQGANLDNASSGEDTRSVAEAVRHIRQEISRLRHDPAYQRQIYAQELTRLQAGFNQSVRSQADERLVALFDQHSMHAQKALARSDERAMREVEQHLEAMRSIYMGHLLQDPRFLTAVFQHRLQRRFLATDLPEFDRLIAQGQRAIEMEDINTLRAVIFRMDENLMTTDAADSDLTEIASLMRG